ncbi:LysM peptidoglycan-binding domain-containing protein [Rhodobacteraceae bacterium XHP0102]|nr:LysM peptidoglycan-binding domain-containing protein [Rhodobacteraceae bacterium XHP0102]
MANGSKMAGGLSGVGMGVVALALAVFGFLGWQVLNEAPATEDVAAETATETVAPETVAPETADADSGADTGADDASAEATAAETAAAPATDETTPAVVTTTPLLDVIRVAPDGMTVIAGSAMPNAEVFLLLDGADSAEASADRAGNFVLLSKLAPSENPRLLSVEATDETGARVAAEQTLIVAPIAAPVALAETEGAADGASPDATQSSSSPIVLRSDARGVSLVQGGGDGGGDAAVALSIDTVSYSSAGDVQIAGRADAGAALRVYLNNALVAETAGGADGTWRADVMGVAAGEYDLRVDQLAADGTVTARSETRFTREAAAQIAEASGSMENAIRVVTVERGFTLWGIAENMLGSGFDYVQIFDANRDQIRDPDLIYPGQVFTIPAP